MRPPAAPYHVESGDNSFYADFLSPLEGSEVKRGGRHDVTARVSGVSVQKLRHLEPLLAHPWDVMIAPATGYPTPGVRRILVPNAATFLVQKILIHEKRDPDKRAKNVLYIHDTIETFGGNLAATREQWQTSIRLALHAKVARLVERAAEEYFHEIDDTIREAARRPQFNTGNGARTVRMWMAADLWRVKGESMFLDTLRIDSFRSFGRTNLLRERPDGSSWGEHP